MKDVKSPSQTNLIPRLLSGGTLRRADSRQEPIKKRGEPLFTLARMWDTGVGKS